MKKNLPIIVLLIFCFLNIPIVEAKLVNTQTKEFDNGERGIWQAEWRTVYTYEAPNNHVITGAHIELGGEAYKYRLYINGNLYDEKYNGDIFSWKNATNFTNIEITAYDGSSVFSKRITHIHGRYTLGAKIAGEKAESAAQDAKLAAQQARDNASEAKSKANAAHNDADYIRSTQLPGISSDVNDVSSKASTAVNRSTQARNIASNNSDKLDNLDTKVANLESSVNNLQTSDTTPPDIKKIKGRNGATGTENSNFDVVVEANDNSSSSEELEFRVKADTGSSFSGWTSLDNYATATGIENDGAHEITVEVRDKAGNISNGNLTIFKL